MYDNCQDLVHALILMQCYIHLKSILSKKFGSSHGEISNFCTSKEYDVSTPNWRASCKKGIYRILANFHFLQDQADFWQTDLFWLEKHRSVIFSVD